jgi:hypothetical protein
MAAVKDLIIQTLEPKITPPSINVPDLETSDSDKNIRDGEKAGYAQQLGKKSPLIKIGNSIIAPENVVSMSVSMNSIIPTIHVAVIDTLGTLTSRTYPRTNLLITAFVAQSHPKLKSFSQSFLITNVNSIPLGIGGTRYDFFGELYVPNLNGNFIKSYNGLTSAQALKKIAEELGLGFATNEDTTDDKMTWINPNLNYKSFIKQVTDHSYKNEKSFFECFIDRYYVLNFINVEKQFKQFSDDKEISDGYPAISTDTIDTARAVNGNIIQSPDATVKIILTNSSTGDKSSEMKILQYSMIGENGDILKNNGFRKRIFIYKHGETDPLNTWFVEPLSEASANGVSVYQLPDLQDYIDNDVVKWMGTDYNNAHSNYKFAKLLNNHNLVESNKNALLVKLPGFNHNILRGSRVKVNIFSTRIQQTSHDKVQNDLAEPGDSQKSEDPMESRASAEILDTYLSDTYYVKSIDYHYNTQDPEYKFTTTMILGRKNWVPEPKVENKQ